MTLAERILQIVKALPSSDSSVTLTRSDLVDMVEASGGVEAVDLTVDQVAAKTHRATSTVRGWLIAEELRGYKLNGRDWRVTQGALQEYLKAQDSPPEERDPARRGSVDITAWRRAT